MPKVCLNCQAPIVGRSDKKYCDDACRSSYNNRKYEAQNIYMRKINAVLRKNRKILEMLNPKGKVKLNISRLQEVGFNFEHFTHIYTTAKGTEYRFCYDYGYLLLPPTHVLIVRNEK